MDEKEYYEHEENAARGQWIAAIVKHILDQHTSDGTMASLQRAIYRGSEAGISVSFELHDGSFVYSGDPRANEIKDPENWVRAIGVSSIVEGSDAEVPLTWIDLADAKYDEENGAERALADFDQLCDEVNDEACLLWEESHPDGEP
jgi:hypothetical protein